MHPVFQFNEIIAFQISKFNTYSTVDSQLFTVILANYYFRNIVMYLIQELITCRDSPE